MKTSALKLILVCGVIAAGSNGCSGGGNYKVDAKSSSRLGLERELTNRIGFSRSVVARERRFATFNAKAERVAVFDPDSLDLKWSRRVTPGVRRLLELSGFDGLALERDDSLDIVAPEGGVTFPLALASFTSGGRSIAVAETIPMLIVSTPDSNIVQVIRNRGDGTWQNESLELSSSAPDFAPEGYPATLIAQDGKSATVLWPDSSALASLSSSGAANADLKGPTRRCPGDPDASPVTAWVEHPESSRVFAALESGRIAWFDSRPDAACVNPTTWSSIPLETTGTVTRLSRLDANRVLILQSGGHASILRINDTDAVVEKSLGATCAFPASGFSSDDTRITTLCLTIGGDSASGLQSVDKIQVEFRQLSAAGATSEVVRVLEFKPDKLSGLSLDQQASSVIIMSAGAAGNLSRTNLLTGESTVRRGIYLPDIITGN